MSAVPARRMPFEVPAARTLRTQMGSEFESTPARLLRFAVIDWAIILATWLAIASFDGVIVSVIGIVIVSTRLHALGALLHDACHSPIRSRAWPLLEALAGWPIASTIVAMRYHHLRHHRHSGTPADPYRNTFIERGAWWRIILVLRGALLPLWWTARAVVAPLAHLSPKVRRFYARAFLQDRSGTDVTDSAEVFRCIRADYRQLAAQFLFTSIILYYDLPVVQYYLLPWVLAGISNAWRVLYEHTFSENPDSRRNTVDAATIDHNFGTIGNSLLIPHNLGCHRAHHLYPTASFVHLPQITAQVDRLRAKTD